jgi:protein-L-isoaspartate(D-aspartate) O-methyltransferase
MADDFAEERERMVQSLLSEGLLRSPDVIAAMSKVPREQFVPEHLRRYAYSDTPLPTEHGQTISAPHGIDCRALHGRHNERGSRA